MRYHVEDTAAKHERIVKEACPASRRSVGRVVGYAWKCDGPALSVRHVRA